MAIFGTLNMLSTQANSTLFKQALHFLRHTELNDIFAQVTPGHAVEMEISGRAVYAVFQTYVTKDLIEAKTEGHRRYIDIQYLHSGAEQILVTPVSQMVKDAEYDEERDLYFPKTVDYSSFKLTAGTACILYPDDLHAPCIRIDAPTKVEKIVIKVAVEQ